MRKPTKALVAILLCGAVSVDADVVRTRGGGSGGAAAAVTPGVTTVTGCQNRLIYGDNASLLNCEAALGYVDSTNTVTADVLNFGSGLVGTPSIAWAADADGSGTGFYRSAANTIAVALNGSNALSFSGSGQVSANIVTVHGQLGLAASFAGTQDVVLFREGAAILQLGTDVNGAAVPQTIKAHDGITGTDIAGSNLTVAGGRGTGAGVASDVVISTGTALATGTTAQTLVARQHIEGGLRALTDATATTVFTVTTGNDLSCGGTLFFTVEAADAANQQTVSGSVAFAAADNAAGAGGEACNASLIGTNATAATSGTLVVTSDATTGTDLCNIRLTATGSLTETVGPRARYSIVFNPTSSSCAVTPQ